jgi:mannose-6-phosphate isomerase
VISVANGAWKGKSLTAIIDDAPVEILGTEVYTRFGKQFPLLFKYLDAREDLSIQVHPNDEKKRHHLVKQKCGISCKLMMMPE